MLLMQKTPAVPVFRRLRGVTRACCAAALATLAALATAPVAAQEPVPPPPRLVDADGAAPAGQAVARRGVSAARAASSAASGAASASGRTNARPHVTVIEDDNVRIEEARARGQVQRITVQNKAGSTKDYDIIVTPGGKDTSQDRGAMGQRAWSLFEF